MDWLLPHCYLDRPLICHRRNHGPGNWKLHFKCLIDSYHHHLELLSFYCFPRIVIFALVTALVQWKSDCIKFLKMVIFLSMKFNVSNQQHSSSVLILVTWPGLTNQRSGGTIAHQDFIRKQFKISVLSNVASLYRRTYLEPRSCL